MTRFLFRMMAEIVVVVATVGTASCVTVSQHNIHIPDFVGDKPVILNFFFNSCEACNEDEEELEDLYTNLKDKVLFKAIETDCDEGEERQWIAKYHPKYAIIPSCDQRLEKLLEVSGYPTLVVLSHDGQLLLKVLGRLDILYFAHWRLRSQRSRVLETLKQVYPDEFRDF